MKILRSLALVSFVIVLCVLALASCGGKDDHVHAFSDATCTAPKTCSCGATEGEALGHTAVTDAAVAPTCTATGLTEGSHCSVCDTVLVAQTEVAATGHTFADATCTAPKTCSTCGATEGEANGHTAVTDAAVAPTCTETGLTEGSHCSVCDEVLVAQTVVEATGHSYEAVVTDPTCTAAGYTTYTCVCGDTYTEAGDPAINHTYNNEGVCSGCNGVATTVNPVVGKGYIFGMYQGKVGKVYYLKGGMSGYYMATTTNPAEALFVYLEETEGGYYAYCFVDGTKTYINMVVSGTHVNGAYEATASTVYTLDTEHHTLIANVSGADYWFATRNDNTYTTMGPCKVSYNGFYGEFYDAHIHSFEAGETTAPTCTEAGYTTYNCACGATEKRDLVDALGHTHVKGDTVAPTCTEAGYTAYVCACGDVEKRDLVDALGHNHVKGDTTAPTCTEAGYTAYVCACGDVEKRDLVDALGHSFQNGTCGVCGEKDPNFNAPAGSADFNTIVTTNASGDSGYTKTYTTVGGWITANCAIQTGGATVLNPTYPVIGPDNTHKAACLNGKTSAPGKLTSPTLEGGVSKIVINFTKIFTDTELSVTVTVTDLATGTAYTHVIAKTLPKDEKYVVYTDEWTLDVAIKGQFTIEVVNNCPTAQDKNKDRFTILSLEWYAPAHEHEYELTATTATCTTAGTATYTCSCGDTYTEDVTSVPHVDKNLDITCDYPGCTTRILPPADSLVSLFTARHMIIVSQSNKYYFEGVVTEITDAKNGIFIITDAAGDTILVRLPKDANGTAYAKFTEGRVVVGDTIRLYGNATTNTGSDKATYPAKIEGAVLTVLEHEHVFGDPTCTVAATCACGGTTGDPLGHIDEGADNSCDRCGWRMDAHLDVISTAFEQIKETDKYDATAGTATFAGAEFTAVFSKGTATLNTNGSDHMRLQKGNILSITSNNGKKIISVIFTVTSSSYVDELQYILDGLGITYTLDDLTFTVELDSVTEFTLNNTVGKIARIKNIQVVYID